MVSPQLSKKPVSRAYIQLLFAITEQQHLKETSASPVGWQGGWMDLRGSGVPGFMVEISSTTKAMQVRCLAKVPDLFITYCYWADTRLLQGLR